MLEQDYTLRWNSPADLGRAFPTSLTAETAKVIADFRGRLDPAYRSRAVQVAISGQEIVIPQRIHLLRPPKSDRLIGSNEAEITSCLLTRDCDGFERQRGLTAIIGLNRPWSVPYVMLLVGEYVIEHLAIIRSNLDLLDSGLYKNFITENPQLYEIIKQRIASYWDAYYRDQYPQRDSYVGFQIIDEMGKW